MYLRELIEALAGADQDYIAPLGFGRPDSYRGYYDHVAFTPERNVSVASMLANARSAMGATFEGYKGGEYTMGEFAPCWIARYGSSEGDCIGPTLVAYLTGRTGE